MPEHDYEYGLLVGKVDSMEVTLSNHKKELDDQWVRLQTLEKIVWIFLGASALQFGIPLLDAVI